MKENGGPDYCLLRHHLFFHTINFLLKEVGHNDLALHVDFIAQMNGLCNHGCNYGQRQ